MTSSTDATVHCHRCLAPVLNHEHNESYLNLALCQKCEDIRYEMTWTVGGRVRTEHELAPQFVHDQLASLRERGLSLGGVTVREFRISRHEPDQDLSRRSAEDWAAAAPEVLYAHAIYEEQDARDSTG